VELGIKNRTQVIALAVLGVVALVMVGRALWPSATPATTASSQASSGGAGKPALRRTASGKFVKVSEPRLDPTLDLDLLQTDSVCAARLGVPICIWATSFSLTFDHHATEPHAVTQPHILTIRVLHVLPFLNSKGAELLRPTNATRAALSVVHL